MRPALPAPELFDVGGAPFSSVCVESRVGGAGQGLVAFATGALDKLDYAVKFFLHRPSFHAERALYKSQTLGKLLPQVRRPPRLHAPISLALLSRDVHRSVHACTGVHSQPGTGTFVATARGKPLPRVFSHD